MEYCRICKYPIPWYSETCLNGHDKIRRRPTKLEKIEARPTPGTVNMTGEVPQEDIGKKLGITRQGVSFTEVKVLKKLRLKLEKMGVRCMRDICPDDIGDGVSHIKY